MAIKILNGHKYNNADLFRYSISKVKNLQIKSAYNALNKRN